MSSRPAHRILLVAASTRAGSLNGQLLRAAAGLAPSDMQLSYAPALADLPLYDQDFDTRQPPQPVQIWRQALQQADGIVIATPEYNHGIPGLLKNAIDWASSPYRSPALSGKVIAVMVATQSRVLGFLGLQQTQTVLQDMGNFVIATPQVVVAQAAQHLVVDEQQQVRLSCPTSERLVRAQWHAMQAALAIGAGPVCRAGDDFLNAQAPLPTA